MRVPRGVACVLSFMPGCECAVGSGGKQVNRVARKEETSCCRCCCYCRVWADCMAWQECPSHYPGTGASEGDISTKNAFLWICFAEAGGAT